MFLSKLNQKWKKIWLSNIFCRCFSTLGIYYLFNIREMIISNISSHIYWIPCSNWNGPVKQGLSLRPSVLLSVLLSFCLFLEMDFFKFIIKFGLWFFSEFGLHWNYLPCCCLKHKSRRNLIPEIWIKILLANQITGFLRQLRL